MKIPNRVDSYVPVSSFYEGKQEAAGRSFWDRFAVVDVKNGFSILASRGENLEIGTSLSFDENDQAALERVLFERGRALIGTKDCSALFFGDWAWGGLFPVLLLPNSCADLRTAIKLLFREEIIVIGHSTSTKPGNREMSDLCRNLSESLSECDSIFGSNSSDSFRRHAARISSFAGCRADFSKLTFDQFALSTLDLQKWTILLLCLFLSLRGINGEAPVISLQEVGRETLLSGIDVTPSQDARKQVPKRFSFLNHPAFRDIEAEQTPNGLCFSVVLSRRSKPGELCAFSESIRFSFLLQME